MATTEDIDYLPAYTPVATASRDPNRILPDYTNFADWTHVFTYGELGAPLTCHPDYEPEPRKYRRGVSFPLSEREEELLKRRRRTFTVLWCAIRENDSGRIRQMIETDGIISPCALNYRGASPLTTAVLYGELAVVRLLVSLGADVNKFAVGNWDECQRTPLQVAAARGNFTIVRFLVEECRADDALFAPDGQLALRLAADAGYREIVAYLPLRRGGGWWRWKAQHSKAMERARKAAKKVAKHLFIVFCEAPYYILLYGPYKTGKLVWRHKRGIAAMVAAAVARTPFFAYRAVKEFPRMVARLVGWLWKVMKNAPEKIKLVAEILGGWLGKAICELGHAVAEVFGRLFSVLHTIVIAMFHLMKDLTLRDIWNGFCMLVQAVFVNLPKTVARDLAQLTEASYESLKVILGVFGKAAWWVIRILGGIIVYIPVQILHIAKAFASSIAKGFREMMVWYDPKRS